MSKFIKRIIAVLLSFVIVAIPVAMNLEDTIVIKTNAAEVLSENIATGTTSFSYTDPLIYVADCISKNKETSSGNKPQVYTALLYDYTYHLMAEALIEKEFTVGFSAIWNNINNLMNGDFKDIADGQKVFYEIVLMDYMVYTSYTDDFENNCYDLYINSSNKIYTSLLSEYSSSGVDNVLDNMSKMEAVEFAEKYGFLKEIGVYADFVGGVLDGASTVKEYYDNLARAMAICEVSEGRMNFLRQIREIGANADDKDLVEAADEIIELYEGACAEFVFNKDLSASLDVILSCIWDAIVSENPVLKTVKLGTLCINTITNGEEVSENNLKLLVLYIVNSYTEKALRNDRDAYLENSTNENARKFLNTYTCYLEYQKYATECARGFTSAMLLEGAWNALKKENKDTYETFCRYFADDISFCENMNGYISVYNDEFYENVGYNYSFGTFEKNEYTGMYEWPKDGEVTYLDKDIEVDSVRFKVEECDLLLNYTVDIPTRTFPRNAGLGREYKGYYSTNTNIIEIHSKTGKITPVSPGVAYACVETVGGIVGKCKITVLPFEAEKVNGGYKITNCEENSSRVTIPSSIEETPVTGIGVKAFSSCDSLISITIPDSVISISERAFAGCDSLTSIKVDADNKYYDSRDNCNAVIETSTNTLIAGCRNTVIPNSVTSIGDFAFEDCWELTSITIPKGVTSIGDYAFSYCRELTSITIPNSVTSIGDFAFLDCWELTSITIPKGVTSIGDSAFSYCKGLTSIAISDSVISIGDFAFERCMGLTSITIPKGVTSIGDGAFSECMGLTSITIPNSVTSIGDSAFMYCTGLTSITIPNSVTNIGYNAFECCLGLTSLTVEESNPVYDSRNNCNAIIETSTNTLIRGCIATIIPNSVTGIGDFAFMCCEELTSITIPNSVTNIGYNAFYGCSGLTNLIIPDSVTGIGSRAFIYCRGLTSVTISNNVSIIDNYAFYGCSNLNQVYYFGDDFNNISIGTNNSPLLNANITYLKLGDADCDKTICINDATLIQLYLANIKSCNDENLMCADVNDDGVISIMDATLIQMFIAQLIPSL